MRKSSVGLCLALLSSPSCGSTVTEPLPRGSVQLSTPQTVLVAAETVQLTWVVKDDQGVVVSDAPITFSTSDPALATVSGAGVVTAIRAGSVTITASAVQATGKVTLVVAEGGVVGPAGGMLSAKGGAIELVVPAGALTANTAIRLSPTSNPLLDPTEVVGSVYSVEPAGLAFAVPAMVKVAYNPAARPVGLPEEELRVRQFDGAAWTRLPGGSADVGTAHAMASLSMSGLVSVGWVVPEAPCTDPKFRQFDFWLGSWNVTENGQPAGLSDITLAPGGCAVLEHFRSAGVGRSISFYQPTTDMWYQTYIDDGGTRVLFAGRFQNGGMDLLTPPGGGQVHGRTRWTAEGTNSRQQVSAPTNNGGATYGPPQYDFLYIRR